jgi:hypothetical protein
MVCVPYPNVTAAGTASGVDPCEICGYYDRNQQHTCILKR